MNPITPEAERLARRLRMAAEEFESAARYGVPIPRVITLTSYEHDGLAFAATEEEYAAWAEYTEAEVEHYERDGHMWSRGVADCNGLRVQFAVCHKAAEVSA